MVIILENPGRNFIKVENLKSIKNQMGSFIQKIKLGGTPFYHEIPIKSLTIS